MYRNNSMYSGEMQPPAAYGGMASAPTQGRLGAAPGQMQASRMSQQQDMLRRQMMAQALMQPRGRGAY